MGRLIVISVRALLLTLAIVLLSARHGVAQEGSGNRAGIVVVDGEGRMAYGVVQFDEPEISGVELLRRSGAEPATVLFGGLGEGVCSIGNTGCSVDVCRRRVCQGPKPDDPFWKSFAPDGQRWIALQLGASADKVRDGEVRLWAWTGKEPDLPILTLPEVSELAKGRVGELVWPNGQPAAPATDNDGEVLAVGGMFVAAGALAAAIFIRQRTRSAS